MTNEVVSRGMLIRLVLLLHEINLHYVLVPGLLNKSDCSNK